MPPSDHDNDTNIDTRVATEDSTEGNPGRTAPIMPIIVGLALIALVSVAGIAWFVMTEPTNASIPQTVPAMATETPAAPDTRQFRGDTRSPSEIIRAARRAQERRDNAATEP